MKDRIVYTIILIGALLLFFKLGLAKYHATLDISYEKLSDCLKLKDKNAPRSSIDYVYLCEDMLLI